MLQKSSKFLHAKYKKLFLKTKVIFCELDNGILTRSKKKHVFQCEKDWLEKCLEIDQEF